jgi:hypothetical protein
VTKSVILTVVVPPTLSFVTVNPTSVIGGISVIGTVSLTAPALPAGAVVALSTDNAAAIVPPSVTVQTGATSASFTVSTNPSCATMTATISASYAGLTRTTVITVTPGSTDTITIDRADYFRNRHALRVSATSSIASATLQVFVTSSGALIGALTNDGAGRYSGEFTLQTNPQSIIARSSSCGSATKLVNVK